MALHWTTVHAVLWTILFSFTENVRASSCAEVNCSSTVVPFGSSVTASCYIKEECSLTKTQDFFVKWETNVHFLQISNSTQKNVHEVFISNFTEKQAVLECLICLHDYCNVVGAVVIRAVSPPPVPQNLTCLLNVNYHPTLVCTWDPGKKTSDIPTNYTLYTELRDDGSLQRFVYFPPTGENFYRVPREGFTWLDEVHVYVIATNAVGQAQSNILVLTPMTTAKLDAPVIEMVGTQAFGCLEYKWSLSPTQKWIQKYLHIEITLKPVTSETFGDSRQQFRTPGRETRVCGLLHGMRYESRMRVRYHNSSPWSEWSNSTVATTPMKAPTGRLLTWLKLPRPEKGPLTAELFWKPSLQFRANSMNVSYTVSQEFAKKAVCVTDQQHCSFQIHAKVKKVYLKAMNAAGISNPTEVPVYRQRELDPVPVLKIFPQSEESFLAKWKSPDISGVSAYVLEWKALGGVNPNHVSFEIVDRNQTSFVASGLKPYIPYEISLYPKYYGGIGRPTSTVACTKQKAPSTSPKLEFKRVTSSFIELSWGEIPMDQRNGIITGYKIFYKDEKNNSEVKDADITKRCVVLEDLYPFTLYELTLMTSTQGGSVNGTSTSVTTSIDAFEIVLIVIPACVGLALFFFGVFTCVMKQKWMKKYVWPVIPDPNNSNIKEWTTAGSLECMPPFKEVKDPVYLSHVSLLNLSEKESKGDENIKNSNWPYKGKIVDACQDDSSHDSESFDSEQQSESVPYATVVFAEPYRRQPVPPPVYLRSESTQPLLGEDEPSSPRPYEKMTTQANLPDVDNFSAFHKNLSAGKEKASLWVDFPMLRSLEINSKT